MGLATTTEGKTGKYLRSIQPIYYSTQTNVCECLRTEPSIGWKTVIAREPDQEVEDVLSILTKDGSFDRYVNLVFTSVTLIASLTLICFVLNFFSNYEPAKRRLAKDEKHYKEMATRIELKN